MAKALDRSGKGSVEDINAAIEWVVDHGATVVDLSLGDPNFTFSSLYGASLRQGVEYAWSKGAIPVLAAGNASALGLADGSYAGLDAVVVGSTNRSGTPTASTVSTGDAKWAVVAPGGSVDGVQGDDILSTDWVAGQPNSYGYLSGTSMAAPFVSGALALLVGDGLAPQSAVDRLLGTTVSPAACGDASPNCRGEIDLAEAMNGLPPAPLPTTTEAPVVQPSVQPTTTIARAARITPPAAPPVSAAAPAVMRPSPVTSAPKPPPTTTAAPPPTTQAPPGRVIVGLAATDHGRQAPSDVAWFVAMACVFALLVAAGIVRVMRAPPPEGLE